MNSLRAAALLLVAVLIGCSSEEPIPVSEPAAGQYMKRGKELVKGLAACGYCHGNSISPNAILSGGRQQEDRFGDVAAANITPAKSGLQGWSTMELMRVFRAGRTPQDEILSRAVHKGYEWLSDQDLLSIVAYIRAVPPVENEVDRRSVSMLERNTTGIMESTFEVTGFVPEIEKAYPVEYGRYLVDHVARCGYCHDTSGGALGEDVYLGGGQTIRNEHGEKVAPNITSSDQIGLGGWSEDEIVKYLQTGEGPGNRVSDPNFCPVGFYANAAQEDRFAIARYLRSVPAQY